MKKIILFAFVTFLIFYSILYTVTAQSLVLTLQTDKENYILRENVQISGELLYGGQQVQGGLVGITIKDPRPTPQRIVARTLQVGELPQGAWLIEILSATLCDTNGNPITGTLRGVNAFFKATIKNVGPTSRKIQVAINIYDNNLTPLGLLAAQFTIGSGDTVTVGPADITIESSAAPGQALICVSVYTDWPDIGGYPLCPEKTETFMIYESEYESPSGRPLPPPYVESGKYKMNFTLTSEPYPGTYTISAVAWYQGWTDEASTTFTVIDVAAPPRAAFVIKPPVAGPGYEITFDASYSTAEGYGDTITEYYWNFGDSTTGSGKIVKHTYTTIGNYTVTLSVTDNEGYTNTTTKIVKIAIIHNIAVAGIQCLNQIYDNWIVKVLVTVKNNGTIPETFNVVLYANSTQIGTQQAQNLNPYSITNLEFLWNTTGVTRYAKYFLNATAPPLTNETDASDNVLIYGPIDTCALGDANKNREIDIYDVVFITSRYMAKPASPNWNIMADLKRDGEINIYDVVKVTSIYGKKY